MAATDSFVQVAPDSTGKLIDNSALTNAAGQTVQRQRTNLGDPSDASNAGLAQVKSAQPNDADGGLVTRPVGLVPPIPVTGTINIGNDPTTPVPVTGSVVTDLDFINGIPFFLGRQAMAASLPVTLATDQPAIPVSLAGALAVIAADGAIASIGGMNDAAIYGNASGSMLAQLRGINDQLATLIGLISQEFQLQQCVLQALNNLCAAQGQPQVSLFQPTIQ